MKTEIMQKIIEKQDELINVYANYIIGNEIEGYTWESDFQKPANALINDITSLKSQLAEEKEEDVYTKSLRLLTEFMDKTPSEEIAVELRKIANKARGEKPVAYEWHNYGTGHCYVDYIPHPLQEAGYIKRPLFYE